MTLFWNPWTSAWMLHSLTFAVIAVLVYRARPWRLQNQALALALFVEAVSNMAVVLQFSTTDPAEARAFWQMLVISGGLIPLAYLLFLSTFDSPLMRPLSSPAGQRSLMAMVPISSLVLLAFRNSFTAAVVPAARAPWNPNAGPAAIAMYLFIAVLGLFGLAVMITALRRAPPGSASRDRLRAFVRAFLVRDVGWVAVYLSIPFFPFSSSAATETFYLLSPLYDILFVVLIAHGMLRHEALGVQLRFRRVIGGRSDDEAWLARRRREVYRAALEASPPTPEADPREAELLTRLRRDLRIDDNEHAALVASVRDTRVRFSAERRGRFRVERELGSGGEGRVYLAHDIELDRDVVLKEPVIERDARARLLREARAAARVRHPNVVSVHDVIADSDPPILVLEHVPGGTLADALQRDGPWSAARVSRLAADVLSGLQRIHAEGLLHGDIKPANILLDEDGTAKISDFGISAMVTRAEHAAGTPGYIAPEVAAGERADERSDIWSVGVLLHVALTGSFVGGGEETADALTPETALEPDLAAIPESPLAAIVMRALARDPAERFGSATAMMDAMVASGAP